MKNLNGKELMRGDTVLYKTQDGLIAGAIHQFNDRTLTVRIANYPFWVPAKHTVLAEDAFEAFAGPLLQAQADQEAQDKAAKDAPEPPKAEEPPTEPQGEGAPSQVL